MNRILTLGLLLFLISCGEQRSRQNIDQQKNLLQDSFENKHPPQNSDNEVRKHQTFNESIDTLSTELKEFIPNGYSAINLSNGDANLDGIIDMILVLRKNSEEITSNFADNKPDKRPLLLLLGQPDNSYKLTLRNDNAVYCIDCGGVFGDPFVDTTIKNGYVSIEHGIAGGKHWEHVITFKYDKLQDNWFLYKDHFVSYKINDSNDKNAQALVKNIDKLKTKKDFGNISFERFNIYNEDGN